MAPVGKKVLVVDDSEDVREFMRLVLEQSGYSVETAASGEEGFARARAGAPDVILLDVVMPGMDGLQLLLKLRSDLAPPIPPVILCTGFDLSQEEAVRRGAARLAEKPIDPGHLLALVADVLAGRPTAAEEMAAECARVGAARRRACDAARMLLERIAAHRTPGSAPPDQVAFEHVKMLGRYLGVHSAALALMRDERLVVVAASGEGWLTPGLDLGEALPPALAVIESGSSLVLPNAPLHPLFGHLSKRLTGIRCFIGVPLLVEKTAIGVVCVIDTRSASVTPEDLSLIGAFSEGSAFVMSAWARGQADQELPLVRFGPGIAPRDLFERMLDAELRLLDVDGGSMELAIMNLGDVAPIREALAATTTPRRMCAGVLGAERVALYKRSSDGDAAGQLTTTLESIRSRAEARAAGVVDLAVAGLSLFAAPDLIRMAEHALDRTLERESGGLRRVVVEERAVVS